LSVTLYGRDELLAEIYATEAGVVVVEGDSGIGKSALLAAMDSGWLSSDSVPGPRQLGSLRGSLQLEIVDEIAEVLGARFRDHPNLVRQSWASLVALLDRAIAISTKEAVRILLSSLHAAVERRFGPAIAASSDAAVASLLEPISGGLNERLQSLATPDLATELLAIAGEVAALTDSRLILRFDSADVLHTDDLALVSELAERSIASLVLVVGFSTVHPTSQPTLARLESRGATRFQLEPLQTGALETWFNEAGIPRAKRQDIIRISSGYPFFVEDAVRLTSAGENLDQIATPNGFTALLRLAWDSLPVDLQPQTMRLSTLTEPPPDDFVTRLLDLDLLEWTARRERLRAAGVFVQRPDGSVWFHDRRREFIWNQILGATERSMICNEVVATMRAWQMDQTTLQGWIIESLVALQESADLTDPSNLYISKLREIGAEEYALLFALIELIEPSGSMGLFADTTLVSEYASSRFGMPSDPVSSLDKLVGLELVVTSSNEHSSIVGLVLPDPLAYPNLIAYTTFAMGQQPWPGFGSTMFSFALRPLLGPFKQASISVGAGTLWDERVALDSLRTKNSDGRPLRSMIALGIVASLDGQPFTSTVEFNDVETRDRARDQIEFYESHRHPDAASIDRLDELPPGRVRGSRATQISKRLNVHSAKQATDSSEAIHEWVAHRSQIEEFFRLHLTNTEASALGRTLPHSTLLEVIADGSWAEFDVANSAAAQVRRIRLQNPQDALNDPLLSLRLRKEGQLRAGERIVRTVVHAGKDPKQPHALRMVADALEDRSARFNAFLPPVRFAADEKAIEKAIVTEQEIQADIVRQLDGSSMVATGPRPGISIHLLLNWRQEGNLGSWHAKLWESDDDLRVISVKIARERIEGSETFAPSAAEADLLSMRDMDSWSRSNAGDAITILSGLIGYQAGDISIDLPAWLLPEP
jgi:hypothetical protein